MKVFVIFFHLCLFSVIANPVSRNTLRGYDRIYGGEFTEKNQYPFATVSFILPGFAVTGGALISSEYVLTTAQYIYKDVMSMFIYIGAHQYNDQGEIGRENVHIDGDDLPNRMVIHEEFDPETLAKNIALIRLPSKLEFSATIQKINLPPRSLSAKSLEGSTATLMGWGASEENPDTEDYPRHVNVTLMPQAICNHYYPSLNRSLMLCSDGEMNKGACEGDIGTPLIATLDDDSTVLIGIVSFINSLGCAARWPTMYINVIGYLDWIQENMVES